MMLMFLLFCFMSFFKIFAVCGAFYRWLIFGVSSTYLPLEGMLKENVSIIKNP